MSFDCRVDVDLVDFTVDFPAELIENSIVSVSDAPATRFHVGPIRKVSNPAVALKPHDDSRDASFTSGAIIPGLSR